MPITPTQIRARRKAVSFPFAGETANIEYYAAHVMEMTTAKAEVLQAELGAVKDDGEARRKLAGLVVEYIASWDVVESIAADGTLGPLIPLDVEHVATLDPGFLNECILVAFRDAFEVKPNGTASSEPLAASSSPTEGSTSFQTKLSRPKSSFS